MKVFYTMILASAMLLVSGESVAKKKPAKHAKKRTVMTQSRLHKNARATRGGIAKRSANFDRGTFAPVEVKAQPTRIHQNARATKGGIQKRPSN